MARTSKLSLNRETVQNLNGDDVLRIDGAEVAERPGTLGWRCSRVTCNSYLLGCLGTLLTACHTCNAD